MLSVFQPSLRLRRLCGKFLEAELQRELNLSRRGGTADLAETAAASVGIGRAEVGFVEEVEEFGSELQPRRFGYRQCEVLLQTEIELIEGVATGDVAPGVAEGLIHTRNRDVTYVEIIVDCARPFRRKHRSADVRTQRHAAEERRQVGRDGGLRRWGIAQVDSLPAAHGIDAGYRPPPDHRFGRAWQVARESPPASERQVPLDARRVVEGFVVSGRAAVCGYVVNALRVACVAVRLFQPLADVINSLRPSEGVQDG